MAKDTRQLPHLDRKLFLTDGGIETTLILRDGFELPHFAAFHLVRDAKGREALVRYYESYIAIAKAAGLGFVVESRPGGRAATRSSTTPLISMTAIRWSSAHNTATSG